MIFRKIYYAGIFLIAGSTLLLEIGLTKIFSIIHFHYFAFFIVSTALFGYGFSGVFLTVSKRIQEAQKNRILFLSSFLFATTTLISFRLILEIPLRISDLLSITQMLYMGAVYLLLGIPFFFSGIVIGVLLTYCYEHINQLYFADLAGAGIGCFAIVIVIPFVGGSGTILVAATIASLAAVVFANSWNTRVMALALAAIIGFLIPHAEQFFPSAKRSEKRHFQESIEHGEHLYTGWSPASRIDVVSLNENRMVIWIDGGTNQSFMGRLQPNVKEESPGEFVWKTVEIPYAFIKNPNAMIIGPGGGIEVQSALTYHPKSITAVELDPLIVQIVLGRFSKYIGGIYKRPDVSLVNEEGRSFIRRSDEKYDIIQQKANSHPMAIASGALNLSETYLLTKEAFHEYLDHLAPNGFLTIGRQGGIRLLNLGREVLLERGVKDYWKRMVLIGERDFAQVFLMKNGIFTDEELAYIMKYCANKKERLLYSPSRRDTSNNVFTQLMRDESHDTVVKQAPFELEAPTDDKPFMEHFYRVQSLFSKEMREKGLQPFWASAGLAAFTMYEATYSDLSLYVILVEASLLSTIFIIYPLLKMKREGIAVHGAWSLLIYFFSLGAGFILIEICFIQKYILFIGYPVYAVAAILSALLIAAGVGSYCSSRLKKDSIRILRVVICALVTIILIQIVLVPWFFRQFLAAPFIIRIILSILLIFPCGFFMGMPFPIGLSLTAERNKNFIPWAWGINGYATVIGSVLSVILALHFGFRVVLLIAAAIYVLAYFSLSFSARQRSMNNQ
ncbi:hypothetical protein L0244_27345 [bacterium]|nr:hypothetical protein [bacterium]